MFFPQLGVGIRAEGGAIFEAFFGALFNHSSYWFLEFLATASLEAFF